MRALVVVDYQNDFVDGALGSPDAVAICDAVCDLAEAYLSAGDDVFVTMDTHDEGYMGSLEGRFLPVPHCIRGTEGWRLHGRLREIVSRGGCTVLEKGTFGCERLLGLLRGYDEIELCGVATNVCVLANAVIARTAAPDARVVVRRSAVASYDRDLGERALGLLPSIQVEVVD